MTLIVIIRTHNSERFKYLLTMGLLTSDIPNLPLPHTSLPREGLYDDSSDPDTVIQASDTHFGQLDEQHKKELTILFDSFFRQNRFPTDPKRVPE